MGVSWIAVAVAVIVVMSLLIGLALALMAEGTEERDPEVGVLAALAKVRSPSGRPFFATAEAVQDFVQTLDESREERRIRR